MPAYAQRIRVTPRATGPQQVLLSPFDAEQAPTYALPRTPEQRDAELRRELLRYVSFGILAGLGGLVGLILLIAFLVAISAASRALPF